MRRPRRPSTEDLKLWRHAIRDVEPLPGRAIDPEPEPAAAPVPAAAPAAAAKPPAPAARPAAAKKRHPSAPPVRPAPAPILPGLPVPGVDRRTADRLRRGRLAIAARIDLHGMGQAAAHQALAGFIEQCHRTDRRMVLVITGKGTFGESQGVLRVKVPDWLNAPPLRDKVLAFHPAQSRDGGAGALYVLLRRRREPGR